MRYIVSPQKGHEDPCLYLTWHKFPEPQGELNHKESIMLIIFILHRLCISHSAEHFSCNISLNPQNNLIR